MKIRFIATLAMAATAAAIGLAPIAAAAPTGTLTTNTGGATVVQSPGNAQVTAQPGAAAVQAGSCSTRSSGATACPALRSITATTIADGRTTSGGRRKPPAWFVCQRAGPGRCGATLMGDRVTGVRVTPISGCLVDRGDGLRGRSVSAGSGPGGAADGGGGGGAGGGGGGGAGGRLLVASSVDTAVVGAVSVTDVVASSTLPGLRNTSRTAATTRAAAAAAAAINAIRACFPRYHGAGAGSKYQLFESNALNAPSGTGSGSVQKPSAASSQGPSSRVSSPDV